MSHLTKLQWYEWCLACGVVMLFGSLSLHHCLNSTVSNGDQALSEFTLSESWIEVEVYGAVRYPGRYKLPKGATYKDLLSEAGPLEGALIPKKRLNHPLKAGHTFEVGFKD